MQRRSQKQRNSITNTPRSHTGRNITTVFCITSIIIIIITIIRTCQTPANIQWVRRQPPTTHRYKVSQWSITREPRNRSWLLLWLPMTRFYIFVMLSVPYNGVIIITIINKTCSIFCRSKNNDYVPKHLRKRIHFSFTAIEDVVSRVVFHQNDPMKMTTFCTLQHRKPRVHHQVITQLICHSMDTTGPITIAMTPAKTWPLVKATAWTLVHSNAQWARTAVVVTPTWWPRPKWLQPQRSQRTSR